MKITRRQLRQIIQEELNTSLAEGKKKRKKGQPKDQYLYSTDVANSEDIRFYDVYWSASDKIERDISSSLLEAVKSEVHHHEVHEPGTLHSDRKKK